MIKVREIMRKDFVSVAPSAPVVEVARRMADSRCGVIAVCDRGRFKGMITERDIVSIVAKSHDPKLEPAGSLMSEPAPAISPDTEILDAARLMVNSGSRVLPVIDGERLVGLFTVEDLAQESLPLASLVFARTIKAKHPEVVRVWN